MAIETIRGLAAMDTQSPGAYFLLAKFLNATNDRLAAIDAAKKAVELAPFSAQLVSSLIEFQIVGGRPDDGLATARAYSSSHPGPEAIVLLANTLIRLKRTDEANAILKKSFATKPDRLLALRLSEIAMSSGDPKKAVAVDSDWLLKNPNDFDVRKQYASLLLKTGDKKTARSEFEVLLKQRPEDPTVLNNLGWILQADDMPRALSLVSLAVKIAPRSPQIMDTLGWLKYQRGDSQSAYLLLQRAHNLNADDSEIGYHLALALNATGEAYSVDSGSSICGGWEPLGGPALFLGLSRLMMSQ